ncbi:MAG: DUF4837 family protein [Bacteroidales bacterium]|nr:DUF4837 family protein [Bacteroidales bacterium]
MKNNLLQLLSVAMISLLLICGCKMNGKKQSSSGKTQELMIVTNKNIYNGQAKAALDEIFNTPQEGLNQPEPRFEMVCIDPSTFNGSEMFKTHHNVLSLDIKKDGDNKVSVAHNKWANPQTVITITATDHHSLDSVLRANKDLLLEEYYTSERNRMAALFAETPNASVNNKVKEMYGFSLLFPDEFRIAKTEGNFTWIRQESKDYGLQFYISTQFAGDPAALTEEGIIANIDTLMKQHVPCDADGSYQSTEHNDVYYTHKTKLGDIEAIEVRGLWRCINDFMGGPFISETFVTPDGEKIVTLIGCVYSPSQLNKMVMKRDLLMRLDGICHTLKY